MACTYLENIMSNIIHVNFNGHVAPASDGVALIECVKQAIEEFGEANFALSLVETSRHELSELLAA